jgi:hypothetical protein
MRSPTRSTLSSNVGMMTIVLADGGTASSSSLGSRRGGIRELIIRCRSWMTSSLAGTVVRAATKTSGVPRQPCRQA